MVTGKQVMEIKHTLKEARSLTDPICPLGAAVERWGCGQGELCRAGRSRGVTVPLRGTSLQRDHWRNCVLTPLCFPLQSHREKQ